MTQQKSEFLCVLRRMGELFLPTLANCSLFMAQLLAVTVFILFGIGFFWSVMGHGNEPIWWGLKTLPFAVFWGGSYIGSLLLMAKLRSDQSQS